MTQPQSPKMQTIAASFAIALLSILTRASSSNAFLVPRISVIVRNRNVHDLLSTKWSAPSRLSTRGGSYLDITSASSSMTSSPYFAGTVGETEGNDSMISSSTPTIVASSLASSYAIRIHDDSKVYNKLTWELIPLNSWEQHLKSSNPGDDGRIGEGTVALRALQECAHRKPQYLQSADGNKWACAALHCHWEKVDAISGSTPDAVDTASNDVWSIHVDVSNGNTDDSVEQVPHELVCVLSRIMAQAAASSISAKSSSIAQQTNALLHMTLPLLEGEGCQQLLLSDFCNDMDHNQGVRKLFDPLNPNFASAEIVDMVNQEGQVLGSLPRPFVHTWNLLHRGIGMIVIKDENILDNRSNNGTATSMPEVYVHQRTSTKRIFPSLYDMFVGGVSSSGEDAQWTAAREVAEELGLTRALECLESRRGEAGITTTTIPATNDECNNNPLSKELFQCAICTSYNRCIVTMFAYTCNTALETISWQEEEVAWGDFVPYEIVECSGGMSIDRLVERCVWPGSDVTDDDSKIIKNGSEHWETMVPKLKKKYSNDQLAWESWDYVPDGLLVWESWLRWWQAQQ